MAMANRQLGHVFSFNLQSITMAPFANPRPAFCAFSLVRNLGVWFSCILSYSRPKPSKLSQFCCTQAQNLDTLWGPSQTRESIFWLFIYLCLAPCFGPVLTFGVHLGAFFVILMLWGALLWHFGAFGAHLVAFGCILVHLGALWGI